MGRQLKKDNVDKKAEVKQRRYQALRQEKKNQQRDQIDQKLAEVKKKVDADLGKLGSLTSVADDLLERLSSINMTPEEQKIVEDIAKRIGEMNTNTVQRYAVLSLEMEKCNPPLRYKRKQHKIPASDPEAD